MRTSTEKQVPELRFSGFRNEWSKFIIKDIASKVTDGTHSTPKVKNKGFPYLTAIHVKDGNIDFENCYYLSEKDHKEIFKRCNPEYGDLLMVNIGAGTATVARVNVEYEFSLKNVALIKPNRNLVDSYFLAQIQREKSKRLKHQLASGGAQPFLSLKAIKKLKLKLPTLPEQQKIAAFLSQVDRKIDLLQQKVSALETYKKGVMQQLFSQQLRFKQDDGRDFPDWEEKKLGEIGDTYSGLTGKKKDDFGEGYMYIQYKQIFDNSKIDILECGKVSISESEKQNKVEFGDIFFTVSSETPGEIATASVFLSSDEESIYLNSFCFGYRLDKNIISPFYARYLFRSHSFRKKIIPLAQGSTRFNISKSNFIKLKTKLPTLKEQTKIANFLSAIDQKITHTQEQLEQTQSFKKGLLQKLFV